MTFLQNLLMTLQKKSDNYSNKDKQRTPCKRGRSFVSAKPFDKRRLNSVQNIGINKREKIFYLFCFVFCFGLLFVNIYNIMFTVHDDLRTYTTVMNGTLMDNAVHSAKDTGRISHLWNHILLGIPFYFNNQLIYKIISCSSLLFDFGALFLLLKNHVSYRFAVVTTVLTSAYSSVSPYHNLLVSYALCHQIPIGLLLLSLNFYLFYTENRKKSELIKCCLFLLASCMIYEAFILSLVIFGITALISSYKKTHNAVQCIKQSMHLLIVPVITAAAYTCIYLIWQTKYPPAYEGIELCLTSPISSIKALFKYSVGFFPLVEFIAVIRNNEIDLSSFSIIPSILSIVKAVFVSALFITILKKIKFRKIIVFTMIISGCGIFIPNLAMSFSKKYISWSEQGVYAYLSSFYSFIFLMIFICASAVLLYDIVGKKLKPLFCAAAAVIVFTVSLIADFNTLFWKQTFEPQFLKYQNFNKAISSEIISSGNSKLDFYLPENNGIHYEAAYTLEYIKIYVKNAENIYVKDETPSFENKTICIRYTENYEAALVGIIDENYLTENVYVFSVHSKPSDCIKLKTQSGNIKTIDNIHNGMNITANDNDLFDMKFQGELP